jgi:hypothetical protein
MTLVERLAVLDAIDDPRLGLVPPARFLAGSLLAPDERWARIEPVATTEAAGRRLEEYLLHPRPGAVELPQGIEVLPLAVMFAGPVARAYSAHELVPARTLEVALESGLDPVGADGFLGGYFERLHAADLEGTLALFEADGYMQHSNGHRFVGPVHLREDYTKMFAANGGRIVVQFANVMDDGRIRAFECRMPSGRPAVAVYERGRSGKIAAIRIAL